MAPEKFGQGSNALFLQWIKRVNEFFSPGEKRSTQKGEPFYTWHFVMPSPLFQLNCVNFISRAEENYCK